MWLADGMNHPGQASFRGQFERVADGLRELHDHLPDDWELFTEHKPYEPAFYSSVNNDWGSSLLLAQARRRPGQVPRRPRPPPARTPTSSRS